MARKAKRTRLHLTKDERARRYFEAAVANPVSTRSPFTAALVSQMKLHGDTHQSLYKAIIEPGDRLPLYSMRNWIQGVQVPRNPSSFEYCRRIERKYGLPENYFQQKAAPPSAR